MKDKLILQEMVKKYDIEYTKNLISDHDLTKYENMLNIKFGMMLKEYLLGYGYIGFKSIEFYGINSKQQEKSDMIKQTLYLHEWFPTTKGLIAFENLGGHSYTLVDSDDKVYSYDNITNELEDNNISLFDYILNRLEDESDVKENKLSEAMGLFKKARLIDKNKCVKDIIKLIDEKKAYTFVESKNDGDYIEPGYCRYNEKLYDIMEIIQPDFVYLNNFEKIKNKDISMLTMNELETYLTRIFRGERFMEGFIVSCIDDGSLKRLLERFLELNLDKCGRIDTMIEAEDEYQLRINILKQIEIKYNLIKIPDVLYNILVKDEKIDNDDVRLMSLEEILDASDDMNVDFESFKLIPIFDLYDNDYICYQIENGKWCKFNSVDDLIFKKDSKLEDLFK